MNKKIVDHVGRTITYSYPPKRIISIAPGLTDTLYSLQLENEIVGRTRYCIHPKNKVEQATIVGGTKKINLEKIRKLKPDLILAEKEENTKEIVELLEKEFPVFVAEVQTVQDAYRMIHDLGVITDHKPQAEELQTMIQTAFQTLPSIDGKRFAYVIWKKPYMVVGNHTYIQDLLKTFGLENAFSSYEGRYPIVSEEDFHKAKLDYIFLATEPFPFKEEHKLEFTKQFPDAKTLILDGEMLWYGPRMLEAAAYFKEVFQFE